jgi:hypothetical protein
MRVVFPLSFRIIVAKPPCGPPVRVPVEETVATVESLEVYIGDTQPADVLSVNSCLQLKVVCPPGVRYTCK